MDAILDVSGLTLSEKGSSKAVSTNSSTSGSCTSNADVETRDDVQSSRDPWAAYIFQLGVILNSTNQASSYGLQTLQYILLYVSFEAFIDEARC